MRPLALVILAACSSPRAPRVTVPPLPIASAPVDAAPPPPPPPTYIAGYLRSDPTRLARASVAGQVVARGGAPLVGAIVCVEEATLGDPRRTQEPTCVRTDTTGHYTFAGLLAGSYTLDANLESYRPNVYEPTPSGAQLDFALAPGEHATGHTITLVPGAVRFTGRVTDFVTGTPLPHAIITAVGSQVRGTARAESDASGQFVMWVDSGDLRVTVRARGHATLRVLSGAPRIQELALLEEGSISGTVINAATGAAVADAMVDLAADDNDSVVPEAVATSASGAFTFAELSPGNHHVTVRAPHLFGLSDGAVLVERGKPTTGVVVRVYPVARLAGRVLDETNHPCPGASVSLVDGFTSDQLAMAPRGDGMLVADAVPAGTYQLLVDCPDHHTASDEQPIVVGSADLGSLAWQAYGGGTVTLRALRPDGTLDENATGSITDGWKSRFSYVEHDGITEARGVAPGTYTLNVYSKSWLAPPDGTARITSATDHVTVEQTGRPGAPIRGQVVTATGHPAIGRAITSTASGVGTYYSDATGNFAIDDLGPGTYDFSSPGTDFELIIGPPPKHPVRVTSTLKQVTHVRLVLPPARGVITGTVFEPDGDLAEGVLVGGSVTTAPDPSSTSPMRRSPLWYRSVGQLFAVTDAHGHFAIRQLDSDYYGLSIFRVDQAELNEDYAQVGTDLTIVLPRVADLVGTVTNAGSVVPDDFTVACRSEYGTDPSVQRCFHTGGEFHFAGLRAETYRCIVRTPTLRGESTVTVAEGAHGQTTVALAPLVTVTGRLVDKTSHKVLSGFRVRAEPKGNLALGRSDDTVYADSGPDGRFVLVNTASGALEINIHNAKEEWVGEQDWTVAGTTYDVGDVEVDPVQH